MTSIKKRTAKIDLKQYGMMMALVAIIVLFAILTGGKLIKPMNISNLIFQNSYVIILAIGMLLCILTGGNIDLACGSVVGLIGACAGSFIIEMDMNVYLAIGLCLLIGIAIGMWQGFWIAYVGIPPFIVTLAGMLVFRGITLLILKGMTLAPFPVEYQQLSTGFIPDFLPEMVLFGQKIKSPLCLLVGILIALRVALKTVVIPLAPNLNINVAAPLINALGAMIFGPVVAAAAALVSDTLGCIIFPQGPYFFPCAFVEVAGSVLFALFFYRTKMRPTRVILARFSMDLFVNIILNSAVMFWYFQVFYQKSYVEMLLPAIIKNLCMFPIEAFVLTLFLSVIIPVTYKLGLTHDASADKNSMKFTTKQFALLLTLFAVGVGGLLTYLNYHYQTKSLSASYSTSERVEKNQLMQEFVVEESDEYDNVETITIVESAFKEFFTGKITYSVAIYEVTTPLDAEQEEACWKYSKSKAKKDENLTFQSYATIVVDKGGDVVSFELN